MNLKMKRAAAGLIGILFLFGVYGNGKTDASVSAQPATTVERYDFAPDGVLELDLKTGGDVTVTVWDKDEVELTFTKKGKVPGITEISTHASATQIKVSTRLTARNRRGDNSVDVVARLPARISVDLNSNGGNVSITGISGKISGTTMGGNIAMTDIKGPVDFTTMGGNIKVQNSDATGSVKTMGGRIDLISVQGALKAVSMGGTITYDGVSEMNDSSPPVSGGEVYLETMGGDIKIKKSAMNLEAATMGGSITVEEAGGSVNTTTMGGNIKIGAANGTVKASTMGGDINIVGAEGTVDASTEGGDISVALTAKAQLTGRNISLESQGGFIDLTVPKGFPMNVDITLAVDKSSLANFQIKTAIPLARSEEKGTAQNGLKKTLFATGNTGDGSNSVVMNTINGNISLTER